MSETSHSPTHEKNLIPPEVERLTGSIEDLLELPGYPVLHKRRENEGRTYDISTLTLPVKGIEGTTDTFTIYERVDQKSPRQYNMVRGDDHISTSWSWQNRGSVVNGERGLNGAPADEVKVWELPVHEVDELTDIIKSKRKARIRGALVKAYKYLSSRR